MARRKSLWRYRLEAAVFLLIYGLFRLLPLDAASAFGGWLGQRIGPWLKWQRIARKNLQLALPELSQREHEKILDRMWNNLGRTAAEYAWLGREALSKRIRLTGDTVTIFNEVRQSGKAAIFASGHFANWEIPAQASYEHDVPLLLIYRHLNNPGIEKLVRGCRKRVSAALARKGREGAAALIKALKENQPVGLLVDQKMNDGIALPFFGKPAMTASATAELALKYGVPIVLARTVRTGGAHFDFMLQRLELPQAETREAQVTATMIAINEQLEAWVREYPEQWLWLHQRWGKIV